MDNFNIQSLSDSFQLASLPTCLSDQTMSSIEESLKDHQKYLRAKKLKKSYQRKEIIKELKSYHKRLLNLMKKRSKKYFQQLQKQSNKIFENNMEEQKKKDMLYDQRIEERLKGIIQSFKQKNGQNNLYSLDFKRILLSEYKQIKIDFNTQIQIGDMFMVKMQKCCKYFAKQMLEIKSKIIKYLQK